MVLGLKSRTWLVLGMGFTTDHLLPLTAFIPFGESGAVYIKPLLTCQGLGYVRLESCSNFPSAFEAKTGLDLLCPVLSPLLLGFPDPPAPSLCALTSILGTMGWVLNSLSGLGLHYHQLPHLGVTPNVSRYFLVPFEDRITPSQEPLSWKKRGSRYATCP